MRKLYEINADIDNIQREMSRLVIAQSDMDEQLARYDRRLSYLMKEKEKAEAVSSL